MAALVSSASAEKPQDLKPTNYVNDFAGVLSADTQQKLDQLCSELDQKTHAQVSVVTIKSLDGGDIDSFAVDLFKQWGIGDKKQDRGVLILLAVEDHKYRTEVGYGLEPILPDGKVGGFGRDMVPLLRANDYDGAVTQITWSVANTIATDANVQLTGTPPPRAPRQRQGNSPSGFAIALFIFFLLLRLSAFRRMPLLMLGGWGGGGWGGGGSGWSGGGGGGFGGFGGGMSGGGGASGGW